MNVHIMVPDSLRSAVEGRRKVELGVPQSADLGDVVQTLIALYPKLAAHLPSDRRPIRQQLNIFFSEQAGLELARHRSGLKEGQVLYLSASGSTPPALARRPTRG
ncbi:MAG: ubiquitin family protein [Myxococcaceae bacterium]